MVLLVGLSTAALADEDRKATAARLVNEATTAQKAGDYPTAIARLTEAYALIPHPDLLYNLGQAHRLAGHPWDAMDQYQRYLDVAPDGRHARSARTYLVELRRETAGKARPAPVEPEPPPVREPEAPPTAIPARDPAPAGERVTTPRPLPTPPPRARHDGAGGWKRPAAIATGVAGLVSLGAGGYFALRARSLSDELTNHEGPWTADALAAQTEGPRAERFAIIASAAGGALVVSGALLFALDARSRRESRALAIVPAVGPGELGFFVRGDLR